jgi:mannose-6-phosphate isomerase
MLKASPETIKECNAALLKLPKSDFGKAAYVQELIPRLIEQYDEGDNGTIVALITMNYLQLNAGDSIYIPADGIHAYLSGDIIECMARSNNVLNAGFCPRADRNSVDMFCDVLTFNPHDPKEAMLPSHTFERSKNGKTKEYAPPLSEFNMLATELKEGESDTVAALNGPSIMIVTKGQGTLKADSKEHKLSEGYIFFVGQGVEMEFKAEKGLQVFTAYAE